LNIIDIKKVTFEKRKMFLLRKNEDGEEVLTVSYGDSEKVRTEILKFIESVTTCFPHYFNFYCSRCGNCCRRNNIFIRGGDLFGMSTSLAIPEKEVYSKYLIPIDSWSGYDGYIKTSDGKCPFLEKGTSGRHTCKIYEHRPQECVLYLPSSQNCKKNLTDLIEELYSIEIEDETIKTVLKSGQTYRDTIKQEIKKNFSGILSVLASLQPEEINRTKVVIKEVESIIKDVERGKIPVDDFKRNLSRIKKILQKVWKEKSIYSEEIEDIWSRICNLEMEYMNIKCPVTTGGPAEKETKEKSLLTMDNFILEQITFFPLNICLNYKIKEENYNYFLYYSQDKNILDPIKSFVEDIALFIKHNAPVILDNFIKKCYMCGECCNIFKVEIEPSDIKRLADEYKMSEEEFRKEYILPGNYSWNSGSGIIKKVIDEETGRRVCAFLKKGDLNLDYCSVHSFKPDLCREYKPGKVSCYNRIEDESVFRLIYNIHSIELNSEVISVTTNYTCFKLKNPFSVSWRNYNNFKRNIKKIIFSLKEYLMKNYSLSD